MRAREAVIPIATDFAAGLAFALGWILRWQGCAPPSPLCELPGYVCVRMCYDPWTQWPMTFPFGLLLGIAPSVMAFIILLFLRNPTTVDTSVPRLLPAMSGVSVLLMAAGMDLVFLSPLPFDDNPVPWVAIGMAATVFLLSLLLCRLGAGAGSR